MSCGKPAFAQDAPQAPLLTVSSPQPDDVILGNRITVDFIVGNLVLVDPQRIHINKEGQGHLHFWLDLPNATKETATHYFYVEPLTFTHVPPGNHTLVVEVVQNDESSFVPPVSSLIHFKTELPKDGKEQRFISPTPTRSLSSQKTIPNLIPLLAGLILINGGVLWWLWRKNKSS